MADVDTSIEVPGWLWKAVLGASQAALITALTATIAWASNTEERVTRVETEKSALEARVASTETLLVLVQKHDKEIDLLRLELKHISDGLDEIKDLIRDR